MFPLSYSRFYVQNQIFREKLYEFKKKLTSIGPTVQKLRNFFVLVCVGEEKLHKNQR